MSSYCGINVVLYPRKQLILNADSGAKILKRFKIIKISKTWKFRALVGREVQYKISFIF